MADRRSRRDLFAAGLASAAFAAVIIVAWSGGDVDEMTFGDGELHRIVAGDLRAVDPASQAVISGSGTSLRYGRIAFPATLWAMSGGRAEAMRYVQPVIMVLCAGGIAMATRALIPQGHRITALIPFLAVGLSLSIAGGFAEPLSIAMALLAIWLITERHYWFAAPALAYAMLARENAAVVLLGVFAWEFFHGRRRGALILLTSAVPVAAWHVAVAAKFGHLPVLDPWLRRTGTIDIPGVNLWRTFADGSSGAVVVLIAHLFLAVWALRLARTSLFGAVAAASGLGIVTVGSFTWGYIGDAVRVSVFLEVFLILAVLRRHRDVVARRERESGERALSGERGPGVGAAITH